MSDLTHRVTWTFVEAFTGALITFGVADIIADLDLGAALIGLLAAVGAGVGAVLVVVKEYARHRLDDPDFNDRLDDQPPTP